MMMISSRRVGVGDGMEAAHVPATRGFTLLSFPSNNGEGRQDEELRLADMGLAKATDSDEVRAERVQLLRRAIARGRYCVPAAQLADKLIGTMFYRDTVAPRDCWAAARLA